MYRHRRACAAGVWAPLQRPGRQPCSCWRTPSSCGGCPRRSSIGGPLLRRSLRRRQRIAPRAAWLPMTRAALRATTRPSAARCPSPSQPVFPCGMPCQAIRRMSLLSICLCAPCDLKILQGMVTLATRAAMRATLRPSAARCWGWPPSCLMPPSQPVIWVYMPRLSDACLLMSLHAAQHRKSGTAAGGGRCLRSSARHGARALPAAAHCMGRLLPNSCRVHLYQR